jgi:hypothetical protein
VRLLHEVARRPSITELRLVRGDTEVHYRRAAEDEHAAR